MGRPPHLVYVSDYFISYQRPANPGFAKPKFWQSNRKFIAFSCAGDCAKAWVSRPGSGQFRGAEVDLFGNIFVSSGPGPHVR